LTPTCLLGGKSHYLLALVALILGACSPIAALPAGTPASVRLPPPWTPTPSALTLPSPTDYAPRYSPSTSTPRSSLSEVGPWTAGVDQERSVWLGTIWVANSDGSAKTLISFPAPNQVRAPVSAVSPDTARLAFSTSPYNSPATDSAAAEDYSLYLVSLPDSRPRLVSRLFSQVQLDYIASHFPEDNRWFERGSVNSANYHRASVAYAISWPHSLAWSPDGRYLAFVGAIDGPSTDLYVFDSNSPKVVRLSFGPSYTISALWSPDSRYIVHQAVDDFGIARSGGVDVSSLWASSLDGSEPRLLLEGPGRPLGWVSSTYLLAVLSPSMGCGEYDLVLVDVPHAQYTTIWRGGIWVEDLSADVFTFEIPPASDMAFLATIEPPFLLVCPPPSNPSSPIDLSLVPGLPTELMDSARSEPVLVHVDHDQVTFPQR
jgi:hypothetical protein